MVAPAPDQDPAVDLRAPYEGCARVVVDRRLLQEIMRRARWIDRTAAALLAAMGDEDPVDDRGVGP